MQEITPVEENKTRPRGLGTRGGLPPASRRARPPPPPDKDDDDEARQLFLKSLRFVSKVRLTIFVSAILDDLLPAGLSKNILGRCVRWSCVALTSWLVRERRGGEIEELVSIDECHSDAVMGLQLQEQVLLTE